ncbi:MAG TPA: hypothetical protein VFQ58_04400 [Flavisolibacter sp.]|nr:hypothetical protein [Flavisolibacter sp.]
MRSLLLSAGLLFTSMCSWSQKNLSSLPAGKYETVIKSNQDKWERGDIIILDENKYKISTATEMGEYRFSVTAQRVFFTSGPLKGAFAKTSTDNNNPVIVFPTTENEHMGLKISSEVRGYYRQ